MGKADGQRERRRRRLEAVLTPEDAAIVEGMLQPAAATVGDGPGLHTSLRDPSLQIGDDFYLSLARGTIEALPCPVWVLRETATVDFVNKAGRDCERRHPWVQISRAGSLQIGDLGAATLLAGLSDASNGARASWLVDCHGGERPCRALVHLAPLSEVPLYTLAWPLAAALLVLEPPPAPHLVEQWLRRLADQHRFTAAEARLLQRLAAGQGLRAIAEDFHVSYTTVRSHLRMLFQKTGCRRQSELVRLVTRH